MSLEYWNNLQTEPDRHCYDFKWCNGEGSALFAKQPQYITRAPDFSPRYTPYPMFTRRIRVFKNIATVPDITLNYAQTEGMMPLGTDSSPLFIDFSSSPSCTVSHCYTPPLSSPPTSVTSDLSPITTSGQIFDPSPLFYHPLSPLIKDSHRLCEDVSPISATVDLPSLELFTDSPDEPEFDQLDSDLLESSPVSIIDPTITTSNHDIVARSEEEEEELNAKRRRCTLSEQELSSSSPTCLTGSVAAKKALRNTKAIAATQRNGLARPHAPGKHILELSSGHWLKLSPPSITEPTSPLASHPSPPPSLSPSATPELSNVRKRKRTMTSSPLVSPLQSPLPVRLLSVDCNLDAASPLSPVLNDSDEESVKDDRDRADDYIYRDYITARAMVQRRSGRTRTAISYADCDEDVPEKPARGKAKPAATKAKAESDEFKAQVPRNVPKKSRRSGPKPSIKTNGKCQCPFHMICSIPFGRFSDVVRHLESNVLHTHAEKARWECPNCGSRLARADSFKRHVDARACGKRAPTEKVKPVYSPEVEKEMERIRNSDHPAIIAAKDRL